MHQSTPGLAAQVRRVGPLQKKTALLSNRYAGETCVIVTCGPSLAAVPAAQLRASLNGVLTIAVKQAIDVVGEQADFHSWNSFNVTRFKWPSPSTIRCFVAGPNSRIPQWNRRDLSFPQLDGKGGLANSLAHSRDFNEHLIVNDPVRPFGPGIMYELVFYLAVHLGVAQIITVGWDIASSGGKNTHYYDSSDDTLFFEKGRSIMPASEPRTDGSRIPEPLRYPARVAKTAMAHARGQLYNRTASLIGEPEVVGESTAELAEWLLSAGVGLAAVTDSTHLGGHITRLDQQGLFDRLASVGSR